MLDDHRRKAVATIEDFGHRASLPSASLPSYPVTLTRPPGVKVFASGAGGGWADVSGSRGGPASRLVLYPHRRGEGCCYNKNYRIDKIDFNGYYSINAER